MTPKGGIRPHQRYSISSRRSEALFVDYIMTHLNDRGRAGVIVPEGVIFQQQRGHTELRRLLVESCLVAVISLPGGVFQPYSGVKTSILIMDKALGRKTDHIAFFKVGKRRLRPGGAAAAHRRQRPAGGADRAGRIPAPAAGRVGVG